MLPVVVAGQEAELLSMENSAQVFNLLSDVPGDVQDVDELLQVLQQATNLTISTRTTIWIYDLMF